MKSTTATTSACQLRCIPLLFCIVFFLIFFVCNFCVLLCGRHCKNAMRLKFEPLVVCCCYGPLFITKYITPLTVYYHFSMLFSTFICILNFISYTNVLIKTCNTTTYMPLLYWLHACGVHNKSCVWLLTKFSSNNIIV